MNLFTMNSEQRNRSIKITAAEMKLREHIIEKDYWVVWTLWRLFEQSELRPFLTFKGGTSLSKVYGVIKRFSEDCDLSIEKGFFGFGDDKAPEKESSRKKRTAALDDLSAACSEYVQKSLLKSLKDDFSRHLKGEPAWELAVDKTDPDGQTLLFAYPSTHEDANLYIRPSVKLEMGARSEHWPVSEQSIRTYIRESLKDKVEEPEFKIKVLNIERTFWEKATILHAYAHIPQDKRMPTRLARHYYDMHCLLNAPVKEVAAKDLNLLDRVVQHKLNYFASTWSKFETAKKGSLKLVPTEHLATNLKKDYENMRDMFFDEPPEWGEILKTIEQFESDFNR